MGTDRFAVVIGDVHGHVELLRELVVMIRGPFGDKADIYCTGDLIDRGPDSKGVIDLCIKEGIKSVLGNHETWLHQYLVTGHFDSFALHRNMKGDTTLLSYGLDSKSPDEIERRLKNLIPKDHRDYILATPIWRKFTVGDLTYRLSHAGLKKIDARMVLDEINRQRQNLSYVDDPSDAICEVVARANPACVLWVSPNMKDPDLHHFSDGSCQVFGNIPLREPILTKRWIAVDTGCGTRPPYTLSAVILPTREVLHVNSLTSKIATGTVSDFLLE
jgi:hypothetical protein